METKVNLDGFIVDLEGNVFCKKYPHIQFCLDSPLFDVFHHGDFIQFEAEFSKSLGIFLIKKAHIDVTGVPFEMATIYHQVKGVDIFAYHIPLKLSPDRRSLFHEKIGKVLDDRGLSHVGSMAFGRMRKFWAVFDEENEYPPFGQLRLITTNDEQVIYKLNPNNMALRKLTQPTRTPIKKIELSTNFKREASGKFLPAMSGADPLASQTNLNTSIATPSDINREDIPLPDSTLDVSTSDDKFNVAQPSINYGVGFDLIASKIQKVCEKNAGLGADMLNRIIKLVYEFEIKSTILAD